MLCYIYKYLEEKKTKQNETKRNETSPPSGYLFIHSLPWLGSRYRAFMFETVRPI